MRPSSAQRLRRRENGFIIPNQLFFVVAPEKASNLKAGGSDDGQRLDCHSRGHRAVVKEHPAAVRRRGRIGRAQFPDAPCGHEV
jgi:hypothetical protein